MEEYIKKLLEQVRSQKAHTAIGDEIRSHIEDQIEENISKGMDKETAEKMAVEDMGDPIGVGIELDRVHRPKIAWSMVIAALVIAIIGIIVHVCLVRDFNDFYARFYDGMKNNEYIGVEHRFIAGTICGIVAMLLIFFIDYVTVAKYSKVAGTVLLMWCICGYLLIEKWGFGHIILFHGFAGNKLTTLAVIWKNALPLILLFIPLYPGILYKYRGQSSKGMLKAFLWILVPCCILFLDYEWMQAVILEICMLVELTSAIRKGWIKVPKVASLTTVWSFFAILPIFVISFVYKYKPVSRYLFDYIKGEQSSYYFTGGDIGDLARMVGKTQVSIDNIRIADRAIIIPFNLLISVSGAKGTSILTYILLSWGIIAGLLVAVMIAGMIALGIKATSEVKNQLGVVLGSGCIVFLIINTLIGMFAEFRMMSYSNAFLPFISSNGVIQSYVFLGIILSVYKYKDIYAEHVDIRIGKKVKGMGY